MNKPLVGVIIPAYNAENFIAETLDSIFAQTYRPIEIVLVDDGSTDRTAEIVKKYAVNTRGDRTIRSRFSSEAIELNYIYQHNSGPSRARNTGIKAAKGEYIAFLDADDLWTKDKLDKQIELFKKDPTVDVVFSDAKIARLREGKTEETIMFQKKQLNKEFFGHEYIVINPLKKLLNLNFIPTSSVVAKRACFDRDIFFNEERRYAEDWELWLRMSLCFNFAYVDEVCVYKKEKGSGLSANESEMILSMIEVIESFIKKKIVSNENKIHARYLKDTYKWAGYHFMLKGNAKLARELYRKSLKESFDLRTVAYYLKSYLHDFY